MKDDQTEDGSIETIPQLSVAGSQESKIVHALCVGEMPIVSLPCQSCHTCQLWASMSYCMQKRADSTFISALH